ncbi:50S ribosomal protein L1, partial [Halobacteriales archaeon QS_1_69_70]
MADSIEDAVSRALEDSSERNFRETVDLAINLRDLDLEDPNNRVDESIVL